MSVRYLVENGPRRLRCLIFIQSGPVKLLLVLFEMAKCTCEVVSHISSVGRFLIVWCLCVYVPVDFVCAIWSDVSELFIKCFCFPMSVMAVLVPKRMLLFCFVCCFLLDRQTDRQTSLFHTIPY